MKTKGKLSIEMDCSNQAVVVFQPIAGMVWMNRNDLCELFGVYMKTIDECLDNILNARIYQIENLCHYHRYVKRGKICYDVTEVNLEVIITLAFQIDSPQSIILRKWFVERCLKSQELDLSFVEMEQDYAWN